MLDHIMIVLSVNILGLYGIDYFDLHGFGEEAVLSIMLSIVVAYLHYRSNKK